MEEEIDLRPYLYGIARRWWVVVACALVFMLVAGVAAVLSPQLSKTRVDLFVAPQSPSVAFDPRFTDRDATMLTNPVFQRQALIDLGSSPILAALVAERLGGEPDQLLGRMQVIASSDLLRFVAAAPTQAEATALAEAWAQAYQELVGELYGGSSARIEQIEVELGAAQRQFDGVQAELDQFYARGDLVRAEQQVFRLAGLLKGGAEAQVGLYTSYLTRTQELSLILEDARALQAQYEAGGNADLDASLAALVVRARLAGGDELPVQLSFGSAESFAQGQVSTADLERFVTVLVTERDRMVAQADALASDLAAGNTAVVGLPAELHTVYEQDLAAARGAFARAQGQEELLLQRRDLALASLEVLQSRADELRIDQSQTMVNLRLIGSAPERPESRLVSLILSVAVAGVSGLVLGVIIALVLEVWQRRRSPTAAQAQPSAPEPVGRTSNSD